MVERARRVRVHGGRTTRDHLPRGCGAGPGEVRGRRVDTGGGGSEMVAGFPGPVMWSVVRARRDERWAVGVVSAGRSFARRANVRRRAPECTVFVIARRRRRTGRPVER